MTTTLLLVRHGETEWNLQSRLQGHKNSPLTKKGQSQAVNAREALEKYNIHCAYMSPLQRTQDTMNILLKDRQITPLKSANFKEINLGPWEGKTKEETKKSHPDEYHCFWHNPDKFSLSGAETYPQLQKRIVTEIETLFVQKKDQTILVVTHWIAIKVVLAYYTSTPLSQLSSLPDIKNGRFITLVKHNENINVEDFQVKPKINQL